MTPAQLTQLKSELQTDPLAIGYGPYVTAGNDNACADLINALTGPGAAPITLTSQTKGAILLGITPALDQLATGVNLANVVIPAAVAAKWQSRFQALAAGDPVMELSTAFMNMLAQLVTDSLTTQPYIDAFTKRTGSRAEFLWGAGTVISQLDISHAFGRG